MLDIRIIRENAELVKANMKKKLREDMHLVDDVLKLDEEWRKIKHENDQLRSERNKVSEAINKAKKEGKDAKALLAKAKEIPQKLHALDEQKNTLSEKIDTLLRQIPNIIADNVPLGKDDSENVEVERFGEPKKPDFDMKPHQEIAEALGCADFESSARISGNGFYFLEGDLALLNQALLRFALDYMLKQGFTYVETPLMMRGDIIKNVVDLNDQENQIYKIEQDDLYLIGTSEHSLIGRFVNQAVEEKDLPITQTSYSMCFRKEKGSHGLDEKGLFRTHQFNKIEMIVICKPEESNDWYKKMQTYTIEIFKQLELPIRVLQICSGDLGELKYDQIDIEAWSPRRNEYIEVGSCSNLTDAQALMLKIRVKGKDGTYFPHTLNNTAIATSRAMVAILENYQNKDGSITIPNVLKQYMGGKDIIKPK